MNRLSAEAPVLILTHQSECNMLGAVGNTGRNVAALDGHATIVAMVGNDTGAEEIEQLLADEPRLDAHLIRLSSRRTTLKTRFIAQGQQLLRTDQEEASPADPEVERQLLDAFHSALPDADVVLLSDYSKGCLTDGVLREAIRATRAASKPIVADPKHGFLRYDGVTLIKPNSSELAAATGISCAGDDSTVASARKLMDEVGVDAVLVTRSEKGMTLVERTGEAVHLRERAIEVFDVTGAGDTALAVLALALGAGAPLPDAMALANKTCSIVVSKIGTAVVRAAELLQALTTAEHETRSRKVAPLSVVVDRVARWRARGDRIGFTNGCFDLVHSGHVSLLEQASKACDRLIVGLNSDDSVRRLKGEGRPIHDETARASVLAAFGAVDAVVSFADDTPIRPDSGAAARRPDQGRRLRRGSDRRRGVRQELRRRSTSGQTRTRGGNDDDHQHHQDQELA